MEIAWQRGGWAVLALVLAGCGSIAQGVTEAVLLQPQAEDTRACEVRGAGFTGLAPLLEQQAEATGAAERPLLKVLMIHGIGSHTPGYGGPLAHNLARDLGLTVTTPRPKRVEIAYEPLRDADLGELDIYRFTNEARDREMLFYELTWSSISAPSKEAIAFDESFQYANKRASFNNVAKGFLNDKLPDPLVYTGHQRDRILVAARQATCWALATEWSELPDGRRLQCRITPASLPVIERDNLAIVTHSLGSRIVIDAWQSVVNLPELADPAAAGFGRAMRGKRIPVFMLANQLPLIEVGQAPQTVTGQMDAYCRPDGDRFNQRFFNELQIVAFSDPNDLLSYPIPPNFAEDYMDSRLCPSITNVSLNIAPVRSLFGLGEIADPREAHLGYEEDERVVSMMARGAGHPGAAMVVRERCEFWRTDRDLQ